MFREGAIHMPFREGAINMTFKEGAINIPFREGAINKPFLVGGTHQFLQFYGWSSRVWSVLGGSAPVFSLVLIVTFLSQSYGSISEYCISSKYDHKGLFAFTRIYGLLGVINTNKASNREV